MTQTKSKPLKEPLHKYDLEKWYTSCVNRLSNHSAVFAPFPPKFVFFLDSYPDTPLRKVTVFGRKIHQIQLEVFMKCFLNNYIVYYACRQKTIKKYALQRKIGKYDCKSIIWCYNYNTVIWVFCFHKADGTGFVLCCMHRREHGTTDEGITRVCDKRFACFVRKVWAGAHQWYLFGCDR